MKQVQALRVRIAALKDEQSSLTAQLRSPGEVAAHVKNCVATWERNAQATMRRTLVALAYGRANLMHADVIEGHSSAPSEVDLGPLMVAMIGADKVASVLLADLAAVPEGLPSAERDARLKAIAAELFELEVEEERLICETEAEGAPIQRRGDARPEIVLGERDAPEPAPAPQARARTDVFSNLMAVPSPYVGSSRP